LPERSLVLLLEPKRLRDRGEEILAEEADLASALARTWDATDTTFPRLHVPMERLLSSTTLPVWSLPTAPDSPDTPAVAATGWAPVVGDGEALTGRLRSLLADGHRVVVAADGAGSAARLAKLLG